MKAITYQLPGDSIESARLCVTPNRIECLDDADKLIRKWFGSTAEIITFWEISKQEFCEISGDSLVLV